jgi:serine/threonine protein kinase
MSTTRACPDDTELLALALGEPVVAAVAGHIDECADCRAKRDRFQAEAALLRGSEERATTTRPLTTEHSPAACQHGKPADAGNTQDWTPADSLGTSGTDPVVPEATSAVLDHAEAQSELPDAIGRYKVVGRLGAGGEAEVYRVVHIKLGNDLVLKLSRRRVGTDQHSGLVEEGRLLVDLEHPNLVRIYDLDFHDDRPFLVMEYVHGRNLEQYSAQEPVTPRRAAALVAKLANVMAVAHRHGIIHCDIKPRNILIDKSVQPRLIDFGMARMRHAWSDGVQSPVGGTLSYMAPEQARLEIDRIGPRTDIFALGGVLYFLLAGHAPITRQSQEEVWDQARRCDFDAGALRTAKVPRALERICLKAMAADPASRYPTADALANALESYLRRPVLIAALGLSVLIPAVALGLWSRWPSPPPSPGTAAVPHPAVAPAPAPLVNGLSDEKPAAGSNPSTAFAPTLLTGELTVRVWSKTNEAKRGLIVGEPGALPLLAGENVRLEARLNQPAYLYLLWLDGQGHVSLLYPRADHKFGGSPLGDSARLTLDCPEALDEGLKMQGPGGLETALLLVRRTPLPPGTDLAASIGRLPSSPLRDPLEVAKRGGDEGQPIGALRVDMHRGIDEAQTEKIDDPLIQLLERLRTQIQFEVVKWVRFAYRGK